MLLSVNEVFQYKPKKIAAVQGLVHNAPELKGVRDLEGATTYTFVLPEGHLITSKMLGMRRT